MTLDAFRIDISSDIKFKEAVQAFDQLCSKETSSLTLHDVHFAIETLKNVTSYISEDVFNVLTELGRSSALIEFLREVLNDDIRNLIDAVEEHSEQYVRESTVSSLIEVKRVLHSVLKEESGSDIQNFFILLGKSVKNCGVKNIPGKMCDCMENIHSLKNLYINVTNKGENTKEMIEQLLNRGNFYIWLEHEEPMIQAEYKISGKMVRHSEARLNDLRSRALLMMNTSEKEAQGKGSPSRKSENLSTFVKVIDTVLDISNTCHNLRRAGHFEFLNYKKKIKQVDLENVCVSLHEMHNIWMELLKDCRERFYFMNFIHSSHLQHIHAFFHGVDNSSSILSILKFINPHVSYDTLEEMRISFSEFPESTHIGTKLYYMAEIIQNKFVNMHLDVQTFKISREKKSLTDVVQEGKLHVVVEDNSHLLIHTLLAIYLSTSEMLPESNQVLFCNMETTKDEILLLLSRCTAAYRNGLRKKLFSLVNIQLLPTELCFEVVDCLRKLSPSDNFLLVVIIGGDRNYAFLEEFADKIMPIRPLTDNEMKACVERQWPDVITLTSDIPGLGKTEQVHNFAFQKRKSVVTLHLSGPFVKNEIVKCLSNLNVNPYHLLHVDVAVVDDPVALDLFLFELVAFGYVAAGSFSFGRPTNCICIEIANSVRNTLTDSLATANFFKRKHLQWENYSDLKISSEINSPVQVVCHYLLSLNKHELDTKDKYFSGFEKEPALSETRCRTLLREHFSSTADMSFTLMNIFINVLSDQLKKMSTSVFFRQSNITSMIGADEIPTIKTNLTQGLIDISKEFATRSIHTCRTTQLAALATEESREENERYIGTSSVAELLAKRVEGMIQWEDSNHLIVLFHQDLQTVSALFRDRSKVPNNIKTFFENQIKKPLTDLQTVTSVQLRSMLIKLTRTSQEPTKSKKLEHLERQYALTPDNFLKMILIGLRVKARIPVIIMGETGCGKTSLIRYLAMISGIRFEILSIHAGITNATIIQRVKEVSEKAKLTLSIQHWLFLDEINTCDHLGLICDAVCHHKCLGKNLPPNLVILAACNPYRLRSDNVLSAGLQGKVQQDELSKLVYRVHPLPETMVDFVWDYGRLSDKDEFRYIVRMIGDVLKHNYLSELFVVLLSVSQNFVREKEETDYSVSLRDVERCKRLVCWFIDVFGRKMKTRNEYKIKERSIILTLGLCYHSRFSDSERRRQYRTAIADVFKKYKFAKDENDIDNIIKEEQEDILNRMDVPEGTAKNIALQENVFVILVSIFNKIPVFVVGKPGCSKSLSMQLIRSNLRGKDSRDVFFKTLPQLYCVSFQGSESSTSDGIIKVFEKARRFQEQDDNRDTLSVVILDEIGLAEISRFNPLKVLHSLLEPDGKNIPDVAVVGISNWALDAAKMNRAIHLSRPEMTEKELYETGVSIAKSLIKTSILPLMSGEHNEYIDKETDFFLKYIADAYNTYLKKQKFQNFHGLRDYYSLIKYLCRSMESHNPNICKAQFLACGLLRNFGGLPPSEAMLVKTIFEECTNVELDKDISVEILVDENLRDKMCRHLMLITNGDTVINTLEQSLIQSGKNYVIMYGSHFEDDLTDDYNYRILSKIILCMEQGMVLILKDLESIYGSLYDMLNQNYTIVGNKKNCRVALGPYSNPMCHVHEDFKCVVIVESSKLDYADPPFLNRFEKQQFRFKDLLKDKELEIIQALHEFMESIATLENTSFKLEDCFPIYGEDMLSSLLISVRIEGEMLSFEEIEDRCMKSILMIMFPDALIRSEKSSFALMNPSSIQDIQEKFLSFPLHNGLNTFVCSMLSTHDMELDSCNQSFVLHSVNMQNQDEELDNTGSTHKSRWAENEMFILFTHSNIHTNIHSCLPERCIQLDKVGTFKSEKAFTNRMNRFFYSDDSDLLVVQFDGSRDMNHFQFVKSALEGFVIERNKTLPKQRKYIMVIIHIAKDYSSEIDKLQVNFMSGWTVATLDDLEPPRVPLPKIIGMTLPNAITSHYNLKHCIADQLFWAFTRLRYSSHLAIEAIGSHIACIKDSEDILNIIGDSISSWITKRNLNENRHWQLNVACNTKLLHCSCSFMSAVETTIRDVIKEPLAMFIFRIIESGVLESFFKDDEHTTSRRLCWTEMIKDATFFDYESTPLPGGPECYSCNTPLLQRDMPFSHIIFQRTESLKDDYLEMLRRVKINCGIDEDEDVPKTLLDEMIYSYRDVIISNVPEIVKVDYSAVSSDYFHDFCNTVTSTIVPRMDEKNRILALQWAILIYIDTADAYFPTFLTKLHVSCWTHLEKITAIVDAFQISENAFHSPVAEMIETVNVETNHLDCSSLKNGPSYLKSKGNDQEQLELTLQNNSEATMSGNIEENYNSSLHIKQTFRRTKSDIDDTNSSNIQEDFETSSIPGNATPVCGGDEVNEETMTDNITNKNLNVSKEEILVAYICNKFLSSLEHLQTTTVIGWKTNVNRFLPLASTISYDLEIVQCLRFCHDFVSIIVLPYCKSDERISTIGQTLATIGLLKESFYHNFIDIAKKLQVPQREIQCIICLYIHRCLAARNDFSAVEWILDSIKQSEIPDENLSFLGPILRLTIEEASYEQSEVFWCMLHAHSTPSLGLLQILHDCVCNLSPLTKTHKSLCALMVDVLETVVFFKKGTETIFANSVTDLNTICDLALQSLTILNTNKHSLEQLVAAAFLRQYFEQLSDMENDDIMNETFIGLLNTANVILESCFDEEEKMPNRVFLYFLKCLGRRSGLLSLTKRCSFLNTRIPVLAKLNWNEFVVLTALDLNPLAMHDYNTFKKFEVALKMEEDKEKPLLKFLQRSASDKNHLICVYAVLVNKIMLQRAIKKVTDTDKKSVEKLLECIPKQTMSPLKTKVLRVFSGKEDFNYHLFHLSPDSEEKTAQIVSFLCHLIAVIATCCIDGDLLYDCICNPKSCKMQRLPGFTSNPSINLKQEMVQCRCKTRYASCIPSCPMCCLPRKESIHSEEHNLTISKFEFHEIELRFLRLFVHGCFLSSVALYEYQESNIRQLFEQWLENDKYDDISDFLHQRIEIDWNYLQVRLALNQSSFCSLLHILILENRELLAGGPYSSCVNDQKKQKFEEEFIKSVRNILNRRESLLNEYKKTSFKNRGLVNSKEYLIEEIVEASNDHANQVMHFQSPYFCMTGTPSKENMYAQLLLQPFENYPFLRLVFRKMRELSVCRFILPLLRWHLGVVAFECFKIKKSECMEDSISKLLSRDSDDRIRQKLTKLFESFKESWNDLRRQEGIIEILQSVNPDISKIDLITAHSVASNCIVVDSKSNTNQVLLALLEIQNSLFDDVLLMSESTEFPDFSPMSHDGDASVVRCVAIYDIEKKDIIEFEWDDDTYLRYSQINTSCDNCRGVTYDFRKIEMELIHDVFFGKAYVTEIKRLPQLVFADELFRNCLTLIDNVREKISQKPLSTEIIKGLQNRKANNPSHTVEMLTQIGIILSLLNKTGGDPSWPMIDYLERWKGMISQTSYKHLLPEPDYCLQLCHITSLYEHLEEINGGDIGESLDDRFREAMPNEGNQQLLSTKAKHIKLLEAVGRALKVFIHRNLPLNVKDIGLEKHLLGLLIDPVYWKNDSLVDECVIIEQPSLKIPLKDIIHPLLGVKHTYQILRFIRISVEEAKETDFRISSITANFQVTKSQTLGNIQRKNPRKKFGKT